MNSTTELGSGARDWLLITPAPPPPHPIRQLLAVRSPGCVGWGEPPRHLCVMILFSRKGDSCEPLAAEVGHMGLKKGTWVGTNSIFYILRMPFLLGMVSEPIPEVWRRGELKGHLSLVVSLWGTSTVPVRRVFISILH